MKTTTDLWLAAYLVRKGHALSGYKILGHRKVSYQFDISDEQWETERLQYFNSELAEFEKIIEKLKDLAYGG